MYVAPRCFLKALVAIILAILIYMIFPPPISKDKMESQFHKNREAIFRVARFLQDQKYPGIYITSTDNKGEMFVSDNTHEVGKTVPISDASVADDISSLFVRYHYEVIIIKKNGLYFQRWSNLDYGRGIVYSMDGRLPQNELLTKLEPLLEKNWYFYEEK
jgi:hypothetical protein